MPHCGSASGSASGGASMARVRLSSMGKRSSIAVVVCILLLPHHVSAQATGDPVPAAESARAGVVTHLPLLRHLPAAVPGGCPSVTSPDAQATDAADRAEAERLATEASNAAILGDLAAARDLLAQAAALDPTSPAVAFRLGRTFEDLGDREPAVREYCRYLRLAPESPDAAEVNATIRRIAPPVRTGVPDSAIDGFEAALAHADAGRFTAATDAFSRVVVAAPEWPAPWHNRGVVYAELRQRNAARADFVRYLELEPGSSSRETVLAWIAQLDVRDNPYSSATAFMAGLIPGAGHFYTGRPAMGTLLLLGAGGAAAAGMLLQERHVECLSNPQDGVCPPDQVRNERVERPYMIAGVGVAAAAALIGAIDAARGARSRNAAAPIIRFGSDAPGAGASLLMPDVRSRASQLDLALIRFRF